jgi:hypothetical protein
MNLGSEKGQDFFFEDYQIMHLLEFVGWLESTISNISSNGKKQGLCNGLGKFSKGCRMIFSHKFQLTLIK